MLTPFDDYPIHQTSLPVAHPVSGDRNHYDRCFFNGYDPDGDIFFGAALGVYPNRQVMDAAFSVVQTGRQRSVYASGRMPLDRALTRMGPITVSVLDPMRHFQVSVDAAELGVTAQLTFSARSVAIEEPHFLMRAGTDVVFDYTRLTQFGAWEGAVSVDGRHTAIDPARHLGSRDRSWGVRPVGEAPGGAPSHTLPQFFWLWAPLQFDDCVTHFDANEYADGHRWHQTAVSAPLLTAGSDPCDPGVVEDLRHASFSIDWQPGTRRARSASITMGRDLSRATPIELEPLLTFQMRGLGYLNPDWAQGSWKGELEVGSESWELDDLDPVDPKHLHVQQLVRARWGDRVGTGVLEQLVIGDHQPTGMAGFLDGAPG